MSENDKFGLKICNHDSGALEIWILRPQGSNCTKTRNYQYFYYVSTYILGCMFAEKGGINTYISSLIMFFGQHIQNVEDAGTYFSKFIQDGFLDIKDFIVNPYKEAKKSENFPDFWRFRG